MSRIKVAKNAFSDLAEEDDFDDSDLQQTNASTSSTPKSDFKPGAKRAPMTFYQIFEKALKGRNNLGLNELANVLDESLRIRQEERTLYCDKYEKYDKYNPEQYEELLDKRINCFSSRNEDNFINLVISCIPKTITIDEIKSLIDSTAEKLSKRKPTGHGSLFLIDLLFQNRPEIFNQADKEEKKKLFYVKHENVPVAGPPTLWLVNRAITSPSKVNFTTNELVSFFIDELLNISEVSVSGPYSVWASHIIDQNFKQTNDNKISAHNFTEMIPLLLRLKGSATTNRDQHIKAVLDKLFSSCHVSDTNNYAREIMLHYPNFEKAPKEVKVAFIEQAQKSPSFLKGWVNCHNDPDVHSTSATYLQSVSQTVPAVLNSFPESVIATCNNEIAELKLKDKDLFQTSIRFTIAIAAVSIGFILKKYDIL